MKKLTVYLPIAFCLLFSGCKRKETTPAPFTPSPNPAPVITATVSSFMVLQVDYLTYKLERAKEIKLSSKVVLKDSIPVAVQYALPNDFGSVQINFKPNNDTLFNGGIVWSGIGNMVFPRNLDSASTFLKNTSLTFSQTDERFQNIFSPLYTPLPDYGKLWSAISNIAAFEPYYSLRFKFAYFLYTPSVGMFDPSRADWMVYLFK